MVHQERGENGRFPELTHHLFAFLVEEGAEGELVAVRGEGEERGDFVVEVRVHDGGEAFHEMAEFGGGVFGCGAGAGREGFDVGGAGAEGGVECFCERVSCRVRGRVRGHSWPSRTARRVWGIGWVRERKRRLTVLIHVRVHQSLLADRLLNPREERMLFAVVMRLQNVKEALRVLEEVDVFRRVDIEGLVVDAVEAAHEGVVKDGHFGGAEGVLVGLSMSS